MQSGRDWKTNPHVRNQFGHQTEVHRSEQQGRNHWADRTARLRNSSFQLSVLFWFCLRLQIVLAVQRRRMRRGKKWSRRTPGWTNRTSCPHINVKRSRITVTHTQGQSNFRLNSSSLVTKPWSKWNLTWLFIWRYPCNVVTQSQSWKEQSRIFFACSRCMQQRWLRWLPL